ncbi:MAG TPA: competence protein ComEC, partial [Catenuloplanes sp.]
MSAPGTPGDRRPVDLRLAGFAVATWLSALAGLYGSARLGAVVATTAALAAAAVSGHGLAARLRRYRWVVVGVLLGVVCGSTATAARVVVRDAAPLADLVATGAAVQVDLVARDDPRVVAGPPGRPALHLLAADLTAVRGAGPAPMSP